MILGADTFTRVFLLAIGLLQRKSLERVQLGRPVVEDKELCDRPAIASDIRRFGARDHLLRLHFMTTTSGPWGEGQTPSTAA